MSWNGHAMKVRRTLLDMTQEQVATAVGVSDGTVSAWETDSREPDDAQRRELARILKCRVGDLGKEVEIR